MTELTHEILKELIDADLESGTGFWKPRAAKFFNSDGKKTPQSVANNWNSKFAGKEIFTYSRNGGYRSGTIFGKQYFLHRILWFWEKGYLPETIDHIDGDPSNNRMDNLREASHKINSKNRGTYKNNTSGCMGVIFQHKKWRVWITVDGKRVHLGYFSDFNDAKEARQNAEIKYGYHKNHGKRESLTWC